MSEDKTEQSSKRITQSSWQAKMPLSDEDLKHLAKLLHLSGEEATFPRWNLVVTGTWSIVLLSSITPMLLFVLRRYL